jgi:hypothetical protein
MWSNDPVADEDPDEVSPWSRDDWVPDSAVPDSDVFGAGPRRAGRPTQPQPPAGIFGEPPPEDFDDHDRSSRSTLGRKVVAGAIVLALLIGSAGALLRNDGPDPDDQPPPASEPVVATTDAPDPVTADAPADSAPPVSASVVPDGVELIAGQDPGTPPPFAIGEPMQWLERTIAVPEPLAAIASTELVTLSQDGIVNVTEFPSGLTRSIDVSSLGGGLQLVVGDGAIAVFNSTSVVQFRDGQLPVVSAINNGVVFVESWTGTDNFILTEPAIGVDDPEQEFVLEPDGTVTPLDGRLAEEVRFWSRAFSPAGDVLVTRPGGVYAIDPAGDARRISTGDLLAIGDAHWAIQECDEELRCADTVVSWETGEVRRGTLDDIESFGFIDPVTRISPDGRSIVYRSESNGSGQRRILDVETGSTVDAGRLNQLVYPDAWATDSSGLFITDRFVEFVDRSTGVRTPIEDLDRIRAAATERFTTGG